MIPLSKIGGEMRCFSFGRPSTWPATTALKYLSNGRRYSVATVQQRDQMHANRKLDSIVF
jgi:hypothetical protein